MCLSPIINSLQLSGRKSYITEYHLPNYSSISITIVASKMENIKMFFELNTNVKYNKNYFCTKWLYGLISLNPIVLDI